MQLTGREDRRRGACWLPGQGIPRAIFEAVSGVMSSRWPVGFQDLLELGQVLRHGRLDFRDRQQSDRPEDGMGGFKRHVVGEPCRAGYRFQQVAGGCVEGTDLSLDGQPAGSKTVTWKPSSLLLGTDR